MDAFPPDPRVRRGQERGISDDLIPKKLFMFPRGTTSGPQPSNSSDRWTDRALEVLTPSLGLPRQSSKQPSNALLKFG